MTKKKDRAPLDQVFNVHLEYSYSISDGDDKAIAHVHVYERMMGLWVTNLWVKPDLRGKGLARKLMEALIQDTGDRDLFLSVHPYAGDTLSSEHLVKFYTSLGFSMTAVRGVMFRRGGRNG